MSLSRLLGAVSAVIGAAFLFALIPWQTETVRSGALSPGTFPTVAAVLVVVSGIVQWARPTGSAIFDPQRVLKAAIVIAICLAATLALDFVGYLLAAPLLVGAVMLSAGERRWFWLAVGLLIFPPLIWTIFELVLRRPLP